MFSDQAVTDFVSCSKNIIDEIGREGWGRNEIKYALGVF